MSPPSLPPRRPGRGGAAGPRQVVLAAVVGLVHLLVAASAARAQPDKPNNLAKKPDGTHATLGASFGGNPITDDQFAQMMKNALITPGANGNPATSNVLDAKFFFQECYGGGMLSSLKTALDDTVNWIGGSASQYNERAFGQLTAAENKTKAENIYVDPNPESYWTKALAAEIAKGNGQTVLQSLMNARKNDQVGPNAKKPFTPLENPQWATSTNGDKITLADPNAKSYDIILWAGNPDRQRHKNNILDMYNAISKALGNTNVPVNFQVLYDNGAPPSLQQAMQNGTFGKDVNFGFANRQGLQTALNAFDFPKNPDEEFIFYATAHGGSRKDLQGAQKKVNPGVVDDESFSLDPGQLQGMRQDDTTSPTLTVDYSYANGGTANTDAVVVNGVTLGYLDPSLTEETFQVDPSVLALSNQVAISNNQSSPGDTLTIMSKELDSGDIEDDPPAVPEPPGLALAVVAAGALGLYRVRSAARWRTR